MFDIPATKEHLSTMFNVINLTDNLLFSLVHVAFVVAFDSILYGESLGTYNASQGLSVMFGSKNQTRVYCNVNDNQKL